MQLSLTLTLTCEVVGGVAYVATEVAGDVVWQQTTIVVTVWVLQILGLGVLKTTLLWYKKNLTAARKILKMNGACNLHSIS